MEEGSSSGESDDDEEIEQVPSHSFDTQPFI